MLNIYTTHLRKPDSHTKFAQYITSAKNITLPPPMEKEKKKEE